jgi:flagellar hook-associated protein 2
MAMGIDGLVSGLDTTSLIDALINAEAGTQRILSTKVGTTQKLVTDLQTLNSSVAALASNATSWSTVDKLRSVTASSSASSVAVTADATTTPGTLSFTVDRLAKPQVSVTAAMTAWTGGSTVTLVDAAGAKKEVATGSSLADLAANINSAGAGVTATLVASGTDPGSGDPRYRLQLSGATGAAGAFSFYAGTAAEVTAGTATDLLAAPGAATVSSAQDAAITLWAGTSVAQEITSTSNVFADVLPGVDVTVSAVEASPVTLTVARSSNTATAAATNLVGAVNTILTSIRTKSAVTSTTGTDGTPAVSAGSFTGDGMVRTLGSALSRAVMDPVGGASPSTIGITVTRTGSIEFDATKFSAALAADPAGTQNMLAQISSRIAGVADAASNKVDGTITQRITSKQSQVTDLQKQISDWDDRLAVRRSRLEAVYAQMETALSALQSQSSWLTAQLATTTTSGSAK